MGANPPRERPSSPRCRHRRRRKRGDRRMAHPCGRGWHRRYRRGGWKSGPRLLRSIRAGRRPRLPCPNPAASRAPSSLACLDRRAGRDRFRGNRFPHRHEARSAIGQCRHACKSRDRPTPRPSNGQAQRHNERSAATGRSAPRHAPRPARPDPRKCRRYIAGGSGLGRDPRSSAGISRRWPAHGRGPAPPKRHGQGAAVPRAKGQNV